MRVPGVWFGGANLARGRGALMGAVSIAAVLMWGAFGTAHALQQHALVPDQEAAASHGGATETHQQATSPAGEVHGQEAGAPPEGHTPAATPEPHKAGEAQKPAQTTPAPAHEPAPSGEKAAAHPEAEHPAAHGEHGPALPEISPVPGVTFVETMIRIMEHELHGRFLGWRPNDLVIGRLTDNVNNYQLGVLEAIRFTTFRLKDSLTRMGDADTYDPDLEQALNLFMNRATLFWFPSAETSYEEAVQHLKRFVTKLKAGQRSFYPRVDNFRLLMSTYKDLLGNVNKSLIVSPVSWFDVDDYFYYAKGIAHVYYELMRVIRVSYESQLKSTLNALELVDEINHELYRVEQMDPWIILDSDLDGIFANHRANLNAPLSEVTHIMSILSTF